MRLSRLQLKRALANRSSAGLLWICAECQTGTTVRNRRAILTYCPNCGCRGVVAMGVFQAIIAYRTLHPLGS